MSAYQTLENQKSKLIDQIAKLPSMRMGTLQHQFLPRKRKDGTIVQRGPFWIYTYKHDGKTCGKHLSDEQAAVYAEQIEIARQYRTLCKQIGDISQQMADIEAASGKAGCKKNSRR